MGSDRHDSDRQDFLERQEARQRRRQQQGQQKPSSAPLPRPAGTGSTAAKRPANQMLPAARGKPQAARPGGQPPKTRPPIPSGHPQAQQSMTAQAPNSATPPAEQRKAGTKQTRKSQPSASRITSTDERATPSGPEGRRTAARRAVLEEAAARTDEPRPSLLARTIVWSTAAICGLLILATIGEAWTVHRLNQQVAASQQATDQLQAQNQALQQTIQNLQQPDTIEKEARRLGFIFPGDQPVVIVAGSSPPAPPAKQSPPPSPGFWGFWPDWLKFFFGG